MGGHVRTAELARRTLKRAASTYDRVRPAPAGVVILAYHRVGRASSLSVDLPLWLFEEQMVRLTESAHIISLDAAISALRTPGAEDKRPVVVTFDDGTADFVDVTLPVLVRYRIPATLYVATDYVESRRAFPQNAPPVSWSGLEESLSTGLVTVGSHSHSHCLFDRIDDVEAARDLDRSIELIGERLGVRASHFAYPKALPGTAATEPEVRSRFVSAALAGSRPNPFLKTDPHRLARSPVQIQDGLRFFQLRAQGGLRLEDRVRQVAAKRRYAAATS